MRESLRPRRDPAYTEALAETALAVMKLLDPSDVLDTILSRAGALVGTAHGYAYVLDGDGEELEVRAGTGLFREWIGFSL